jgi:Enolase C-terminal domain-like
MPYGTALEMATALSRSSARSTATTGPKTSSVAMRWSGLPTAELSVAAYEAIGVDSYSSAVLCFAPDIATAFYRAYRSGDKRTMKALLAEFYLPLVELPEAFAKRAVGVVLADHHYWGGLRATQRLAGICETYGVGVSMHSNSHLGISLAAMTHVAAATPALAYASDTHMPWQCGVDVVEKPLSFVDGAVPVPSSPGLGVTLDRDALARMHEDYLSCGIRERDDTGYYQRFHPEYERLRPRW